MRPSVLLVLALALAPLVGCGGGSHANAPAASADRVELAEMTIAIRGDVLAIHADGSLEASGEKLGILTRDGRVIAAKNGKIEVSLADDGRLDMEDLGDVKVTLSPDAVLTIESGSQKRVLSIGPDGEVGDGKETIGIQVKGADTLGKKRAAMLVIAPFTFARRKKDG